MALTVQSSVESSVDRVAPLDLGSSRPIAGGRRNLTIDALRGWCIVMMIVGHTGAFTQVFHGVHFLRFVSGAEGFVFLSGLVLGIVYKRKLDAEPGWIAYQGIWKRVGVLWGAHCVSVVAAVFFNRWLNYTGVPDVGHWSLGRFLWMTATLQFQPGHLLNILPMYIFFLAGTPLVLELFRRGKTGLVLAASIGLFLFNYLTPGAVRITDTISGIESFSPVTWQIFFVTAMAIGFHKATLSNTFLTSRRRVTTTAIVLLFAVAFGLAVFQPWFNEEVWTTRILGINPLCPARIAYFFLSISTLYLGVQWLSTRVWFRRPMNALTTLGASSLYCFLAHLILVFGIGWIPFPQENRLLLEVIPVLSVFAIYLMAKYKVARRFIPN